jgi:hypothetical protein
VAFLVKRPGNLKGEPVRSKVILALIMVFNANNAKSYEVIDFHGIESI